MSARLRRRAHRASVAAFMAVVGLSACRHATPAVVAAPPAVPDHLIAPPAPRRQPGQVPAIPVLADTTGEARVTVDTHGRETDVRDILGFLGQTAGVHFVFSPEAARKIRVTLTDVPLSQAIETVLSVAGLTLEGTTSAKPPPTPAVVFYQIPVNIDSLSVESIVRHFGVSREVAELLVQARPPKP